MRTSLINWKLQLLALAGILSLVGCGSEKRIPDGHFHVTVSNSVHTSTLRIVEMTLASGVECIYSLSHSNRTGTGSSGGTLNLRSDSGAATNRILFVATVGDHQTGPLAIAIIKDENGTKTASIPFTKKPESKEVFDLPEMNRTFAFAEDHTVGFFVGAPLKLNVRPKKDSTTSP